MTQDISVLMATLNGEAFVQEQLHSLHKQSYRNWSLYVSDDGSRDNTVAALRQAAGPRLKSVISGPCAGPAQNFLRLIRESPDGRFTTFCDQDDVWFSDKLARAHSVLSNFNGPALYCSTSIPCDAKLRPITATVHRPVTPDFRNALIENIASGHTIMVNPAGLEVLKKAEPAAVRIKSHDWWAYLCITAVGGAVVYDVRPSVLYRQHQRNAVGLNHGVKAKLSRACQVITLQYQRWNAANLGALQPLLDQMPPQNRAVLDSFSNRQSNGFGQRIMLPKQLGLRRHAPSENLALRLSFALNLV